MKKAAPSAETHPHVFAWFCLCSKFSDAVKNSWTGAAAGGAKGKKGAAPKKETKKADDDLDDLFGDDDDDGEVSIAVRVLSTLHDTKFTFICQRNSTILLSRGILVGKRTCHVLLQILCCSE
jgi:hypothetical protein